MRNCPDQDGFITVRNRRKRNRPPNYWSKLPREIVITILQNIGVLHILLSAQLVCTQWREICTDPSMWASVRVIDWFSYYTYRLNLSTDKYTAYVKNLIRWAVDHSCGSLFDFDSDKLMSKQLLYYVVGRCNRIRRLRIPLCFTEDVLERLASRLPLLEDFELVGDHQLSSEAIETLGRYCPKLTSLKIRIYGDEEAKTIARTMPQLRHIGIPCDETRVTDVGVEALLDSCPHLESLDIQGCYFFKITRAFQMMKNLPLTRTQWRGVLEDPSTWSTICVAEWISTFEDVHYMIRKVVDKSCGGLVDLDLDKYMSGDILDYVTKRCNRIRRLRGIRPMGFTEDVLVRVASRLPLLEDFELVDFDELSSEAIETLGNYCPKLSSLKIHVHGNEEAKTIARSMPQLHHICLSGKSFVTDVGVEAILDGCPHLESLDIQGCYFFEMTGAFQMMKNFPLTRTQWRDVLDDPSTWSTICLDRRIFTFYLPHNCEEFKCMIRRAVDNSCGGLVDLKLGEYMSEDILDYVVERCTRIRRLHGYVGWWSEEAVRAALARLPLLEDLSLRYYCRLLSAKTIQTLMRCCPRLTSLEIPIYDNDEAVTLARSFPQLRHLKLFNANKLTDSGVEALLDGCPNLESLDLRECDPHYCRIRWIRCLLKMKYFHRPIAIDCPSHCYVCGWTCPLKFDLDDNQFLEEDNRFSEEDVYDVDYTICRKEEYWIRREKGRSKETHTRQLRRVKGNKKAKRIRDSKRDSRREVKKEFVHWNKLATDPCTLYC